MENYFCRLKNSPDRGVFLRLYDLGNVNCLSFFGGSLTGKKRFVYFTMVGLIE